MKLVAILLLTYLMLVVAVIADLFSFNPTNLLLHSVLFGLPLLVLSFRSRPAVLGALSLAVGAAWFGAMVYHNSAGSDVAVLDNRLVQVYPLALLAVLALVISARGQARRDQADQAEALARVAGVLERKATRDEVAAEIVAVGQQFVGASAGLLWLAEEGGRSLRLIADHGIGPRTRPLVEHLPLEALVPSTPRAPVDAPREIVDVHRPNGDIPRLRQVVDAEEMRYVWLQPLAAQDRVIGVLALLKAEPYRASRRTRDFLRAIGRLAARQLPNKPDLPYRPFHHVPMRRG